MAVATIICEYNPLHNGHLHHIAETKRLTDCDSIICIMSGNFVERGEPAILNKYTRAIHAIKAGADAVIELPSLYATSSAEYFAYGAVTIANLIKYNEYLSFGSESGNLDELIAANEIMNSDKYEVAIKQNLTIGLSYPISCENAFKSVSNTPNPLLLPNNVLAAEYLRAMAKSNSPMSPITVKRLGGNYHDIEPCEYSSATAIRRQVGNNDFSSLSVPEYVLTDLQNAPKIDLNRLFAIACEKLIDKPQDVYEGHEGLINRLYKASKEASNYDELVKLTHTKRYTLSRIKRLIIHTALGHNSSLLDSPVDYVNTLAIRRDKLDLLSTFPTKPNNSPIYFNDCYANKIYSILTGSRPPYNGMVIIN